MSLDKPVLLVGRQSMNRSVDGDVVVVEIFPKEKWQAPGEEVVDQDSGSIFPDDGYSDANSAQSHCGTTTPKTTKVPE